MNEEPGDDKVSFLKTNEEFLSLTEVCVFFGKCRHTILRWRREENFPEPHVMSTKSLIFEVAQLKKWFKHGRDKKQKVVDMPKDNNLPEQINSDNDQDVIFEGPYEANKRYTDKDLY